MLNIFKLENLVQNIKNILIRFPLSILYIIINLILLIITINFNLPYMIENYMVKGIFTLIITFFFSIWVYITSEKYNLEKNKKCLFQIIPVVFWILFFIFFNNNPDDFENIIFFMLSLVWIISYIFFAPFLKKCTLLKNENNSYYPYFYKISVVFLISTIFWLVLFALWSIWIWATFTLFDLSWTFSDELYKNWAIISLSLLTPIFWLTQIPKNDENEEFKQNKFFDFLVRYIWILFIAIYFIILYAYSIKVLINFSDWPKWEVSWLVIWFSILWYIVYMFSYIFEENNFIVKNFRKIFPFVVIPQIFMLFYAIYLRIAQYDLTTNRYFVVVFWVWLLIISLFMIFSKKKFLWAIPAILTLFTIIISIWPWSVFSLPESRQMSRLENNLIKANILKDWNIIPLKNYEDIDKYLSKEIYNWISYLCHNSDCENIKDLFKWDYNHKLWEKMSNWEVVEKISSDIKVRTYYDYENLNQETIYLNRWNKDIFPINTEWYKKIIKITYYGNDNSEIYWKIDIVNNKLEIIENWIITESIDIENNINEIYEYYKKTQNTQITDGKLDFNVKWNKYEVYVLLENISIKNPDYNWDYNWNLNYSNWYILLK